jgi:hypothetical protein
MIESTIIIVSIVCSTAVIISTLLFKSKCTKVDVGLHGVHAERDVKEELKDTKIKFPKII